MSETNRKTHKRAGLLNLIRSQGRRYDWIASRTGYSTDHISRVARGLTDGSSRFHAAMRMVLGEDYQP